MGQLLRIAYAVATLLTLLAGPARGDCGGFSFLTPCGSGCCNQGEVCVNNSQGCCPASFPYLCPDYKCYDSPCGQPMQSSCSDTQKKCGSGCCEVCRDNQQAAVASCGGDQCSCADPCTSSDDCRSGCCQDGFCAPACVCGGEGTITRGCDVKAKTPNSPTCAFTTRPGSPAAPLLVLTVAALLKLRRRQRAARR